MHTTAVSRKHGVHIPVPGGLQGDRQCTTHRYTTTSSDKVPQGKAKQDEATQKEPPRAGGGRQEIYLIEGVLIK